MKQKKHPNGLRSIPKDWWNYPINPILGFREATTKKKKTGVATGKLSLDQLKALEL
jgi:hypothetical protein